MGGEYGSWPILSVVFSMGAVTGAVIGMWYARRRRWKYTVDRDGKFPSLFSIR